jgi:PAS domain S-box-containing protein
VRDADGAVTARLPDPVLPPPRWASRVPRWGWLLLFIVADAALRRAGYLLLSEGSGGGLAIVWPPLGLALYALLVARRRSWPALLAVALAAGVAHSVGFGRPLALALTYNAANLVEAAAACLVLARIGGRPTLRTLRGALTFLLAPAAAIAVVAAIALVVDAAHLVLPATSAVPDDRFWAFWAGSSLGILFVAAPMVEWTTPGRRLAWAPRAVLPAVGIAVATVLAVLLLRSHAVVVDEVVLLPPLLWAGLRFGPRGATTALAFAVVAVIAGAEAGHGHVGIIAHLQPATASALSIQLFLALGGGSILAVAAVAEERRTAEERRALIERAFDHTADPAGVVEEDGTVVWANEAMARSLGVPRAALPGRRLWEVVPGSSPEAWRERWQRVAASGSARLEDRAMAGDGTVPWEVSATIVDVGGRELMVCALRDLSDRRRAEEASRLAALGTLAAGVAHEINNPLSYVVANVAHVRDRAAALAPGVDPAELRHEVIDPLAEAEEGARRVRDIVRQLRAFAGPDAQVGPVDPARALRAALSMAQNEIRQRARAVTEIAETPPVLGLENRLTQVFLNLLVNAAQAIPEGRGGTNEVRATLRAEGDSVVAEVSDTGAGMTAETRARVFEPFFTTKGPGSGVGLGLAISHSIVVGMGGRIEVESEPGAGSRFRVVLPVVPAAAVRDAAPAPAPPLAAPSSRRRLAVIDDEPLVSRALARILEAEGEVTVVERARDALDRIRAGERFDAIVCDLMMPELSGMALHAELRAIDPALADRMIFVTGGAFTEAAREFLERVPNPRLEKPVDRAALREAVRRVT